METLYELTIEGQTVTFDSRRGPILSHLVELVRLTLDVPRLYADPRPEVRVDVGEVGIRVRDGRYELAIGTARTPLVFDLDRGPLIFAKLLDVLQLVTKARGTYAEPPLIGVEVGGVRIRASRA